MKKAVIVFIVSALVLVSTGIWYFSSGSGRVPLENTGIGVIILLVVFALFIGFKRLTSAKRGEPAEDEMSKKVMVKASSLAYFISLYLWIFVIYINDRVDVDTEVLIGSGVLGMAVIFAICWLVINFRGVRNE